ncbi:MAG: hypothetical protein EOO10_13165 [Chitinophagaceae bacterium]|nr:MAG: hypothetical protein EOO10_13165 [Chitinophagaceae bacterium]
MKPILIAISLLVSSLHFSASAQKNQELEKPSKVIQFKENFTIVSVDDDLEIILTDGASDKIAVNGDVKAMVSDGQLYVSARNPRLAAGTKVFIPSAFLSKVYMNGNGSVSSAAVLPNQKVKILLASEAKINVRSLGNVTVETIDDIQFIKGR